MERTHLIKKNNNQGINMLLNIYGMEWRMDFVSGHETVDGNFHEKDLGFCKISGCNAVEKDNASYKSHAKYCLFEQDFGEYALFGNY
jgi:hypothetical protein